MPSLDEDAPRINPRVRELVRQMTGQLDRGIVSVRAVPAYRLALPRVATLSLFLGIFAGLAVGSEFRPIEVREAVELAALVDYAADTLRITPREVWSRIGRASAGSMMTRHEWRALKGRLVALARPDGPALAGDLLAVPAAYAERRASGDRR
jgi:hypothetical protein